MKAKIVIGANYGDEGKGLATHWYSQKAANNDEKCLNILFNGGAQRGHTVELKDGTRHVFCHFGCGTFDGADTYFDKEFMVNPIVFNEDRKDIIEKSGIEPEAFASRDCRVTTPLDMLINQLKETKRGDERHGSCGMGIYETRKRYEDGKFALRLGELIDLTDAERTIYFCDMYKDKIDELRKLGRTYSDKMHINAINNYVEDFNEMLKHLQTIDFRSLAQNYDCIIFEGAQGLALSEDSPTGFPHLTPSFTNSRIPIARLEEVKDMLDWTEVCYVTRSYFTRHGAGDFPTECSKDDINRNIVDITNEPNEYQGTIRYGKFDRDEFASRVVPDIDMCMLSGLHPDISLLITHENESNLFTEDTNIPLWEKFWFCDFIYETDSKFAENIKCTFR